MCCQKITGYLTPATLSLHTWLLMSINGITSELLYTVDFLRSDVTRHWNQKENGTTLVRHGPLAKYAKLRVAHAPGMPGTFSPPPRVSDPDMHHGACVTHVPWSMLGLQTNGFLLSQCRGKRSRRMRNPHIYVSGKRPMNPQDIKHQGPLLLTMFKFIPTMDK